MVDVLHGMMDTEDISECSLSGMRGKMFVASTKDRTNGASILLDSLGLLYVKKMIIILHLPLKWR